MTWLARGRLNEFAGFIEGEPNVIERPLSVGVLAVLCVLDQ
jgi:hypothetical protein